ncbi:peptidoglycan DD-metalloendopeptidase family protein [Sphingomonas sp. MAH-20]|uniref:Peptidoglycan DD-metalloendopeptidase family protein n=1 Tax=Sphingomonas horti TaxID=2682842 RepID=A0A6I4J454_9SPHN|nr:M23 family metallopeptidase [Sphingomonas sp. CGMCC 1.13658]MVO79225.1 peptidoglycan DD-metalloendopeptidase family protein [Sphingomonas horti]
MKGLLAFAAVALVAAAPSADFKLQGKIEQGGVAYGTAPPGTVGLTLGGEPVPLAPDGRFMLGFDRDAPATLTLAARTDAGTIVTRTLAVAPHAWALQHVNVAKRPPVTNEEFERLRAPEVAQIVAARAVRSDSDGWRQRFAWPAKGRISGVFGSQRIYRGNEPGAYHSGVDIAGGAGAPVTAPADGVVVLAADKPFTLEGNLLMIDHGMGLNSAFLHLSEIDVKQGDHVRKGQLLGRIGSTGRATGPHLHWAMKWRGARIDPMALTGPMTGQDLRKVPVVEN